LDPTAESATAVICDHFKLKNDLALLANEIDTNNIESDNAKRLLEIIGGIRLKYSGSKLRKVLYDFAYRISEDINIINDEIYNTIIDDYKKWVEDFQKFADEKIVIKPINDRKVGILEIENAAPVYAIHNHLTNHSEAPFDILAVIINQYERIGKDKNNKFKNKKFKKIEFRTHTDLDTHELAKLFGGGGHKLASGVTITDEIKDEEIIKTIESYFTSL
jgi:oligoribonuclease NrnB/cAMP/cGMP phosphodiesterase (DHH superfamily)